ncbi:MAG: cysteine-rich small domain-containing protein [Spirochaetaceae bacterium]|nr:cysteine-rich small domain-containing protein [Spirochaetaceae bacterium]
MSSRFFENNTCEYYPCHTGITKINCLFCYCPLYTDSRCPGIYTMIGDIKDCSACIFPHKRENYDAIIRLLSH